ITSTTEQTTGSSLPNGTTRRGDTESTTGGNTDGRFSVGFTGSATESPITSSNILQQPTVTITPEPTLAAIMGANVPPPNIELTKEITQGLLDCSDCVNECYQSIKKQIVDELAAIDQECINCNASISGQIS